MKDSPQSIQAISWTVRYAVVATFVERSPHKSVQKQSAELGILHLTMFDHKSDLVMKSFWPVFVIGLGDTGLRLCYKACSLLSEWFLVALCYGKVLFSDECTVYCSSLSWNFFWGGLNIILITCLRCKTTHHTWWSCRCNCQLYHWPIFLLWNC